MLRTVPMPMLDDAEYLGGVLVLGGVRARSRGGCLVGRPTLIES